jgi:outer membrane immunogenic protein
MNRVWHGCAAAAAFAYGSLGFTDKALAQFSTIPEDYIADWSGFYVGANAGANWGDSHTTVATTNTFVNTAALSPLGQTYGPAAAAGANGTLSTGASFMGGGQAGYNFPLGSGWLAGFEADLDAMPSAKATLTNTVPRIGFAPNTVDSTINTTKQINFLTTARARIGYLVDPSLWLYATGGVAVGDVQSSTNLTAMENPNTGSTNITATGQMQKTLIGYAVGGAAEWLLGMGWSVRAEYLYFDLGSLTYNNSPFTAFLTGTTTIDNLATSTSKTRFGGSLARIAVSYHF